jgi:hypothetical protein
MSPLQLTGGEFSIGFGMNHSWLIYPEPGLELHNQFRPSYSIAVNSIHRISSDVDLSVGLRLFDVGRRDKGTIEARGMTKVAYDLKFRHVYISVATRIGYQVLEGLFPFFSLEPGLLLHSDYHLVNPLGIEKRTVTNEMNRLNIFTGVGIRYLFGLDQHQFGVGGQFNFGLIRVSKDSRFDVTENGSRGWVEWRIMEAVVQVEYYFSI